MIGFKMAAAVGYLVLVKVKIIVASKQQGGK